jgi:osmotically-inducible protein OsmY
MSAEHIESEREVSRRGFENEPADEGREDYLHGGPVRSNEPERDYFFEQQAADDEQAPQMDTERELALNPIHIKKKSFKGRGPRNYRPTDERIRERLCEVLTDHVDIDASDISLEVECGIVQLKGSIGSQAMKDRLLAVAQEMHGVVGIVDQIQVGDCSG